MADKGNSADSHSSIAPTSVKKKRVIQSVNITMIPAKGGDPHRDNPIFIRIEVLLVVAIVSLPEVSMYREQNHATHAFV